VIVNVVSWKQQRRPLAAALLGSALLAACASAEASKPESAGLAYAGGPIAGGAVTLADSSSPTRQRHATTAADGTFAVDTNGLTPPYLLKVSWNDGATARALYAIAQGDVNVDVNAITDLAFTYAAGDGGQEALWQGAGPANHDAAVQASSVLVDVAAEIAPILVEYDVADLVADRAGVRALLEDVTVTTANGVATFAVKGSDTPLHGVRLERPEGGSTFDRDAFQVLRERKDEHKNGDHKEGGKEHGGDRDGHHGDDHDKDHGGGRSLPRGHRPIPAGASCTDCHGGRPGPSGGSSSGGASCTPPASHPRIPSGASCARCHRSSVCPSGGTSSGGPSSGGRSSSGGSASSGGRSSSGGSASSGGSSSSGGGSSSSGSASSSSSSSGGSSSGGTALDGAALYGSKCAGCHGSLASSEKRGRTAAQILRKHGNLVSSAEAAAIAGVL
jgi:hypothetical protein